MRLKNASFNNLAKETTYTKIACEHVEPDEQGHSPEEKMMYDELYLRYVNALEQLPARCREVFIYVREEGQSYAQVAEKMDISVKTVDAQLQKAVVRLKELLF